YLFYRSDKNVELRPLLADTLTIHTDDEQLTLLWRLTLPVDSLPQRIVLTTEQRGPHG
ncbi:DUF2169 domain-containing protein, partial [Escherichia coli]|nr:DUF2169 domain-containing protein [Escherichia coli]EFH9073378.1 DUF2169 domain-containing protein [Escherichia coli]